VSLYLAGRAKVSVFEAQDDPCKLSQSEEIDIAMQRAAFLQNPAYRAASLTHFFVDVLNNSRTLVIALLAVSLGMSNTQVGFALLIYNIGSAVSQPLFGLAADRFGPRWMVVGGMGWMIALYSLASLGSDMVALVAITMAGLGSGSFHPAGTKVASESSQEARTQAASIFFASGQIGLFVGPIMSGVILDLWGRPGYIILPVLALIALVNGWRSVPSTKPSTHFGLEDTLSRDQAQPSPLKPLVRQTTRSRQRKGNRFRLIFLVVVIVCTSTMAIAIMNFAPKLFTDQGYKPSYVGWTAGLYMLGSALGGIVGGTVADRVGRRFAIGLGMAGALLPIYFYIPIGDPWRFPLLLLAGFFGGMPHSVLVIIAQSFLPRRRAFASGLILGLMFFAGAIGSTLLGVIADRTALDSALQGVVLLPLLGLLATPLLPGRSEAKA